MQAESDFIFVYGTLRKNVNPEKHAMMAPYSEFVSMGICNGLLFDVGNYPGLSFVEKQHQILGEIYRITDQVKLFSILDGYEGCSESDAQPYEYHRIICDVHTSSLGVIPCWVYEYQWVYHHLTKIESGDYERYLKSRSLSQL